MENITLHSNECSKKKLNETDSVLSREYGLHTSAIIISNYFEKRFKKSNFLIDRNH